jgi:hypothetical protein
VGNPRFSKRRATKNDIGPGFAVEDGSAGRTLVVTGTWSPAAAERISQGDIDGLGLNYAKGFSDQTLDFIGSWPIRRLQILDRTIEDIEPIYRLAPTLTELSLTTSPRAVVDCARLPALRSIWVENWSQLRASLPAASAIEEVGIYEFDEEDLATLTTNDQLRALRLKSVPRLLSLNGIENMPLLENLEVVGAPHLHDLTALRVGAFRLRSANLYSCGAIASLDDLAGQTELTFLDAGNCGPLDSLHPISKLTSLETLYLYQSTYITDGDLTPILRLTKLRDLRMMNRAHYSPSYKAVQDQLGLSN